MFRIFPAAKGKGNRESLNERSERMAYYGKVEISGVNTANLPVLTGAEAKALFIKCREGNEAARQQLIEGNLRLVLSIIKRFENRNENMDDLFQIGTMGLLKAIDRFDCTYEVRFSTYAVPMISGEIKRFIRDDGIIKISST